MMCALKAHVGVGWSVRKSVPKRGPKPVIRQPTPPTLMQFTPGQASGQRIRIQGTLTLQQSSGTVFIKDATGGVVVHGQPDTSGQLGDRLDVVVPVSGSYLPELEDALIQKRVRGTPPSPVYITTGEALGANYHAQLVQMEALLLDQTTTSAARILTLRVGRHTFNASVENTSHAEGLTEGSCRQSRSSDGRLPCGCGEDRRWQ